MITCKNKDIMKKILLLIALIIMVNVSVLPANERVAGYSGKMPVLFINTLDGKDIVSKDSYVNATFYIQSNGVPGYSDMGSASMPIDMRIRGRGNYTWNDFEKKPYRVKLNMGISVLGLNKSKNFVLLAAADDDLGFLRVPVGFELSKIFEMKYTPAYVPVELVINGDYRGLYFFTEHIRVDSERVDINKQLDNQTDPNLVTGGWLIEIDNYDSNEQVVITEGNGEKLRFTYHTPEILSTVQRDYLINLVTNTDKSIYNRDKNSVEWERYIDIDTLARFYIINEIVDNAESFHGSCYIHKDLGADKKLIFGPVWDFGNSFRRSRDLFIYEYPQFGQSWIGEIAKFPCFQEKVRELWKVYSPNILTSINSFIDNYISSIGDACLCDARRWNYKYGNADYEQDKVTYKNYLKEKFTWLGSNWNLGGISDTEVSRGVVSNVAINGTVGLLDSNNISSVKAYDMSGRIVKIEISEGSVTIGAKSGIYLLEVVYNSGDRFVNKVIIR